MIRNGFKTTGIFTDSAQTHNYFRRLDKGRNEQLTSLNGDSARTIIFKTGGHRIFYLNSDKINLTNLSFDVMVLGKGAADLELKKSLTHQMDTFILYSSLRGKSLEKIKEKLLNLGIHPYSVQESGAWCRKW